MEVEYVEKRSKHALLIDRSIQARHVYDSVSSGYKNAPNRGDLDGYDTKGSVKDLQRFRQKLAEKVAKSREMYNKDGEYEPHGHERERMVREFHKLTPMEQHKDLLVTYNVVRNEKQREGWLQNPRAYDVRGIDTQPEELVEKRIMTVHKYAKSPRMVKKTMERGNPAAFGAFNRDKWEIAKERYPFDYPKSDDYKGHDKGRIYYDPSQEKPRGHLHSHIFNISHELGHALDRNVSGKYQQLGERSFTLVDFKPHKNLSSYQTRQLSEKYIIDPVEKFTREVSSPYEKAWASSRFTQYRNERSELFANWFISFINDKSKTKKNTSVFYNIFRKHHRPLFKALRKSDRVVTRKYMSKSI